MDEDGLISEQIEYYRAIAPQYDVASPPRGDPFGPFRAQIEVELDRFRPGGHVLEIAGGAGDWTIHLLRHASVVTVVDSSQKMHELSRKKTGGDPRVRYVHTDVFTWQPDRVYDVVFFANWLSHVPPGRFVRFWRTVGAALASSGRAFVVDELADAWRYGDVFREDFADDSSVPVVRRSVPDGRTFRLVKVFWNPEDLRSRLGSLGWESEIHTAGPFLWATALPRPIKDLSGVST